MRIRWSMQSLTDRENILEWNAQFSPGAAVRTDNRIEEAVQNLSSFPSLGRAGKFSGMRDLIIPDARCIVFYQLGESHVLILRVLHGSQLWPERLP